MSELSDVKIVYDRILELKNREPNTTEEHNNLTKLFLKISKKYDKMVKDYIEKQQIMR